MSFMHFRQDIEKNRQFYKCMYDSNNPMRHIVTRFCEMHLHMQGYKVGLLASFEPALKRFHDWWMQLFEESDGKERKGLLPTSANYSKDLHSISQFILEGSPILFETLLHFKEISVDYKVPFDPSGENG